MVRRGPYRSIIDRDGWEAAEEAFRENLTVANDGEDAFEAKDQVQFIDASTYTEVEFVRSAAGMVQDTVAFDYLSRCAEVQKEDTSSEEQLMPCNKVCDAGYQCLTKEEAQKKCSEENTCCGEPKESCSCDGSEEKYCFKCNCPECQAVSSWSKSAETFLNG
jgi:hypothetical protein